MGVCCFKMYCLSIQPFPYAKLPNCFRPVCEVHFSYGARSELEESLDLCGMKLPLEFHQQDEWIHLDWNTVAIAGWTLSCLSMINYFLMRCRVFCTSLMISQALLPRTWFTSSLELSCQHHRRLFGFRFYNFCGSELFTRSAPWTSKSQLNSMCQAPGRLPSCRVFQGVQYLGKFVSLVSTA